MGRRKTAHAKTNESTNGTSRSLRQLNHCNVTKRENQATNSKNCPLEQRDCHTSSDPEVSKDANDNCCFTTCASTGKLTMQLGTEDAVSPPMTRSESNKRKDDNDHRRSASACEVSDPEATAEKAIDDVTKPPSSCSSSSSYKKVRGRVRVVRRRGRAPRVPQPSQPDSVADRASSESPAPSPSSVDQAPSNLGVQAAGTSGNNGPFLCPSCNKVIHSQSEYTRHIRQHNAVEASSATHSCSLCGKILSSASSLDRHMLVHSGERPFKCRICGMAFTTNGNMHRHMRTHHDGAPVHADYSPSVSQVSEDETATPPPGTRKSRTPVKRKRAQADDASNKADRKSALENGNGLDRSKGGEGKSATVATDTPEEESLDEDPDDDDWDDMDEEPAVEFGNRLLINPVVYTPSKRKKTSDAKIRSENSDNILKNNNNNNNNNDWSIKWTNGSVNGEMDESLHCAICGKTFLYKTGLLKHLGGHVPSEFRCKDCVDSKVFPNYQSLLKHRAVAHGHAKDPSAGKEMLTGSDALPLQPAAVGFHDLTFIDFSAPKFTLIAKSACEQSIRYPSSVFHIFQCHQCRKAFPSTGSLKMHVRTAHSPLTDTRLPNGVESKQGVATPANGQTTSTCSQCQAAFATHQQLELHCLRHQAAENCATPYSVKKSAEEMDPTPADLAPQLNKENFLALLELQSKTKDDDGAPMTVFRSDTVGTSEFDSVSFCKRQRLAPSSQQNELCNGGDFADIQSILAVTSTAGIIPSMMMGSSPISAYIGCSPPPPESPASPRLADSVTASPELPSEHNNITDDNNSALRRPPSDARSLDSPSTSSSSLTASPSSSQTSSPVKYADNGPVGPAHNGEATDCGRAHIKFACNQCHQVLPNLRALKAHNRIHLGGSPFHCNVCSYFSVDKSTLMRHLRTHNGERPYMCTICQYAFTTKANCERHLRTKHDRRNKADIRGAMRYVAFDVREEEASRTVPSDAANACPHCSLQFVQVKLLKQHLQAQHGDMYAPKPYSCLECGFLISSHNGCLRHIAKHHSYVRSPEGAVGRTVSCSSLPPVMPPTDNGNHRQPLSVDIVQPPHASTRREPGRSRSADDVSVASTSILDLSDGPCWPGYRPASYPGSNPPVHKTDARVLECSLEPGCAETNGAAVLDPTVNSHSRVYDIPPQEQPLDLALYPMDLSVGATANGCAPATTGSCASGPMDLSAPARQQATFPSPMQMSPAVPLVFSGIAADRFPFNGSLLPFHSRPPPPCLFQATKPPLASPVPTYAIAPAAFPGAPHPRLEPPSIYVTPVGGNSKLPTPVGPVRPPMPLSVNDPSLAALSMVSALASARPHISPSAPRMHSSPPSPSSASHPKTELNVSNGRGKGHSSGASGHSRGLQLSTSVNSFLLKKQKQRRYRTERPFKCGHCAAGFTLRSNMERHIKQQHPEFWASKARSRKVPSSSGTSAMVPSISLTPIASLHPPVGVAEAGPFPDLTSFAGIAERPTQHALHKPLLSSVQPKSDSVPKTTISSEVKQAISQQIKQRKGLEMMSATNSLTITPIVPVVTPLPVSSSSVLVASQETPSVSCALKAVTPTPTIKVTETIFPPALGTRQGSAPVNDGGAASVLTASPSLRSSPLPAAGSKNLEDAEDTLADLASVSKLLDTANQQNIQEMFRQGTADDDDAPVVKVECEDVNVAATKIPAPVEKTLLNEVVDESPTPASDGGHRVTEKCREIRRSAYNTAPNRVACPYCHRLFPWTSSLRRHILTHTGQKPFKCPCCPLWFTTKSNCDRHLSRKHGGGGGNGCQQDGNQTTGGGGSSNGGGSVVLTTYGSSSGGTVTIGTVGSSVDCTARNAPDRPYRCNYCLCSTFASLKNLHKHLEAKHATEQGLQSAGLLQLPHLSMHPLGASRDATGSACETDMSVDAGHPEADPGANARSEGGSEVGSNSGSERCWGESEESGEEALPDALHPLQRSHDTEPLFFCFVCLKSFAKREHCLGHLQQEHPDEHGLLAANKGTGGESSDDFAAPASATDDDVRERKCSPELTVDDAAPEEEDEDSADVAPAAEVAAEDVTLEDKLPSCAAESKIKTIKVESAEDLSQ